MRRVTDLDKFSLEQIWRPYQTLFGIAEGRLDKPPLDLDGTALALAKDTEWSRAVLARVRVCKFYFPPYVQHPIVDVVKEAAPMANPASDDLVAVERLRENLRSFDAEVAYQLETEGERADLWTEIDVNVADLRALLARLATAEADRDRLAAVVAEAEKVIEPFVEFVNGLDASYPTESHAEEIVAGPITAPLAINDDISITIGHLRAARAWQKHGEAG